MGATPIGFGKAVPALEVPNEELSKLVQTNDEWIRTRTGIEARRIAVCESTLDLAVAASKCAMGMQYEESAVLSSTGVCEEPVSAASIDLIVFTTITADTIVPSAASALKRELNLPNAIAFDVNAACTGFIYGCSIAESMMAAANTPASSAAKGNRIRRALVVSSERLSRLTDWQDRNTCVLFGDGAGAIVLEWKDSCSGIMSTFLKNDDDDTNCLTCENAMSSLMPFDDEGIIFDADGKAAHDEMFPDAKQIDYSYINSLGATCDPAAANIRSLYDISDKQSVGGPSQTIYMNGQKVFKFAARAMESAVREAVNRAGVSLDDVKMVIPHQANKRIIEFAAKRLGMPMEAFQLSIMGTGNTSSSGVPMALTDAVASGRLSKGDLVVLVAFGGGLTSGAMVMEM